MSLSKKDHDLLARLNALKPTQVKAEDSASVEIPEDLAARFLRFTSQRSSSSQSDTKTIETIQAATTSDEDDKTIEELLADIGPEDQWNLNPEEPEDIKKLMDEVKLSLKTAEMEAIPEDGTDEEDHTIHAKDTATRLSTEAEHEAESTLQAVSNLKDDNYQDGEPETQQQEENEADAALQKILDDLSLENALITQDLVAKEPEGPSAEPILDFPSAPDTLPTVKLAKAGELNLPSATARKPGIKSKLPTYTDEEIDTWCVICNDDATVLCNGCDGDLYCAGCWKEGHTGPDVGFEERSHHWKKYVKPR